MGVGFSPVPRSDSRIKVTAAAPAAGGEQTPDAGRKVIVVKLTTEADGTNRFDPADFEAHRSDVLRFTLGMRGHVKVED